MTMKTTDSILGPVRGSAATALAYAQRLNAKRFDQVTLYINRLYAKGVEAGVDPSIAFAQAVHETTDTNGIPFASSWWVNRLNPAGMGITGDAAQDNASHTWANGADAADSHLAHLLLYATGAINRGGLLPANDPRYAAYIDAYGNTPQAKTINDLTGKWGTDPQYAIGIVTRGAAIFGNLTTSSGGMTTVANYSVAGLATQISLPVPLVQSIIPVGQTNQRPGIARQTPGYIVVHETANTNARADADMHARYLANGADGSQVSWHFTVDDHHIVQNIPINEVTWQAADGAGPGNMSGVSMELCVNSDGDEAKTRHNAEALIGALCKALGLGQDRIKRHYDFNAADPDRHHCPDHIMNEGYWPTLVANANKIITGGSTVSTTTTPAPKPKVVYPAGMDAGIAAELFGSFGTWKYAEGGTLSTLWLENGKTTGEWPRIVNVKLAVDSPTITRTYWQFENGLTWWRPNDKAALAILK